MDNKHRWAVWNIMAQFRGDSRFIAWQMQHQAGEPSTHTLAETALFLAVHYGSSGFDVSGTDVNDMWKNETKTFYVARGIKGHPELLKRAKRGLFATAEQFMDFYDAVIQGSVATPCRCTLNEAYEAIFLNGSAQLALEDDYDKVRVPFGWDALELAYHLAERMPIKFKKVPGKRLHADPGYIQWASMALHFQTIQPSNDLIYMPRPTILARFGKKRPDDPAWMCHSNQKRYRRRMIETGLLAVKWRAPQSSKKADRLLANAEAIDWENLEQVSAWRVEAPKPSARLVQSDHEDVEVLEDVDDVEDVEDHDESLTRLGVCVSKPIQSEKGPTLLPKRIEITPPKPDAEEDAEADRRWDESVKKNEAQKALLRERMQSAVQ